MNDTAILTQVLFNLTQQFAPSNHPRSPHSVDPSEPGFLLTSVIVGKGRTYAADEVCLAVNVLDMNAQLVLQAPLSSVTYLIPAHGKI